MGALGTGMALDTYPYKSIARRSNVSQTQELRQRMQGAAARYAGPNWADNTETG